MTNRKAKKIVKDNPDLLETFRQMVEHQIALWDAEGDFEAACGVMFDGMDRTLEDFSSCLEPENCTNADLINYLEALEAE